MVKTSAPGRICLFGEHQDYLHLPVITAAINLRITVSGTPRNDRLFTIDLPDISKSERFQIPPDGKELSYVKKRDYFRSVFNVLRRFGAGFDKGWDCRVESAIPINSGTSSSSALCVAWARFLTKVSARQKPEFPDPAFIGRIAYLSEVREFGEPGGMMDQNASALGGVLYQAFEQPLRLKKIPVHLGTFVLGDSRQPKDTMAILTRVKFEVLEALKKIKTRDAQFKLESASPGEINAYKAFLSGSQLQVLQGALLNRDITQQALKMFKTKPFNASLFSNLLNAHHSILSGNLNISTPTIDRMLRAAMDAGARGGKINGSGGGGCMFVYAPAHPHKIAEAIEREGGRAYILKVDEGVR